LKVSSNNEKAGGGGHGGWGGSGGGAGQGGAPYDSTNQPATPGSGGGGSGWSTGVGGAGGGAVWIEASGEVTLFGTIRANGVNSSESGVYIGGAGSGGAIYIGCNTLKGSTNGLISANGGNATLGGSGGGGRIGLQYDTAAQQSAGSPGVRFTANAGTGTSPLSAAPTYARPGWGTVWMPDDVLLSAHPMQFQGIGIANPTNWSVDSLSITGMTLGFLGGGLITVSNNLSIGSGGILALWEGSSLDVRIDLILTNGGQFSVYSASTNASIRYGAVIGVTGDVTVATGSRINLYSEPSNGGSPISPWPRTLRLTRPGRDSRRGFIPATDMGRAMAAAAIPQPSAPGMAVSARELTPHMERSMAPATRLSIRAAAAGATSGPTVGAVAG
jgi:hypothetical protein